MDNLNRNNFFNAMAVKYPKAMAKFLDFIDQYKKDVEWDKIFDYGLYNYNEYHGIKHNSPKFHELPYELQIGVILKFGSTIFNEPGNFIHLEEMKQLFETCFKAIESPDEKTP